MQLQGGLPPVAATDGAVVEIACDESGFSGSNLLDAATPVITHASVDLSVGEAADLIARLRSGVEGSPDELKSAAFLRGPRAGDAQAWFLAALSGRAHVHVIDKEYFLATRIVDFLLAEPTYAAGTRLTQDQRATALALYRARAAGGHDWGVFLAAFVELVRTKRQHQTERTVVDLFFRARDSLAGRPLGAEAAAVLDQLSRTRVRKVLSRLRRDDPSMPPPLEPMLPALAETVLFWSRGQRQVLVAHDEQSALTAGRLTRLQEALADAHDVSPLAGLVMVDSRDDPRVQVADLLAGLARRGGSYLRFIASGHSNGPRAWSPTSLR